MSQLERRARSMLQDNAHSSSSASSQSPSFSPPQALLSTDKRNTTKPNSLKSLKYKIGGSTQEDNRTIRRRTATITTTTSNGSRNGKLPVYPLATLPTYSSSTQGIVVQTKHRSKSRPRSNSRGSPLSRSNTHSSKHQTTTPTGQSKANTNTNTNKIIWSKDRTAILSRLMEMEEQMEKQNRRMKEIATVTTTTNSHHTHKDHNQVRLTTKPSFEDIERLKENELRLMQELSTQQLVAREALQRLLCEQEQSQNVERELERFQSMNMQLSKQIIAYEQARDKSLALEQAHRELELKYSEIQRQNSDKHLRVIAENKLLTEELANIKSEMDRLKRTVRDTQKIAETHNELKRDNYHYEEKIRGQNVEIARLQDEITSKEDTFRQQLSKINAKVSDWSDDLSKLRQLEDAHAAMQQELEKVQELLNIKVSKYQQRKLQWNNLYGQLNEQIVQLQEQVDQLKADNTHFLSSYSALTPSQQYHNNNNTQNIIDHSLHSALRNSNKKNNYQLPLQYPQSFSRNQNNRSSNSINDQSSNINNNNNPSSHNHFRNSSSVNYALNSPL